MKKGLRVLFIGLGIFALCCFFGAYHAWTLRSTRDTIGEASTGEWVSLLVLGVVAIGGCFAARAYAIKNHQDGY